MSGTDTPRRHPSRLLESTTSSNGTDESDFCRFLSLADELILAVIEHIDQSKDLCTLARTCSRFQALAEPYIYQSVLIRTGNDALCLVNALDRRPVRALSIENLAVRYVHDNEIGIEQVNRVLGALHNLRHLTVESPCLNNTPWRGRNTIPWTSGCRVQYASLFRTATQATGLQTPLDGPFLFSKLQTVFLHTHGDIHSEFELGDDAIIFRHPTLRNLTISCSDITTPFPFAQSSERSTSLRSLTFIECNIDAVALHAILRYPRALKEIDIGERVFHFHQAPTTPLIKDCQNFMDALHQQHESLESIKHTGRRYWRPRSLQMGNKTLRDFRNLRRLALDPESILTAYLITHGAPDSLEILRLFSVYVHCCRVPQPVHPGRAEWKDLMKVVLDKVPNARQVDIVLAQNCSHEFSPEVSNGYKMETLHNIWQSRERRQDVYRFAFSLQDRGRHFKLYAEHFEGGNIFIPPFLYGEVVPVERVVYDSEEPYFFNTLARQKFHKDAEEHDRGYGKRDEAKDDEVIVLGLVG